MHRFKLSTNNTKRPWKNAKQNSISAFPHLGVAADNEKSMGYCWIFILCQIGLMVLMTAYHFFNNLGQEQN